MRRHPRVYHRSMYSPAGTRLVGLLFIVWVISGVWSQPIVLAAEWQDVLRYAEAQVDSAKKLISSRRVNEELLAALAAAQAAIDVVQPPAKPEPVARGSTAEEQEQAAEEDKRRLVRWMRECDDWRTREGRLRSRWVEVLGEFLVVQSVLRISETNLREEVNRRALGLLVATGRTDAATVVARAFTGPYLDGPRYYASQAFLREMLEAMERLRSVEALDVLREMLSSRDKLTALMSIRFPPPIGGAPAVDPHALFLRVIGGYENVPGRLRYLLVRDLVETYAPMEEKAAGGGLAGQVWNRIREAAIDATWHHAGRPTHDTGTRLATMHELEVWFRANRSRSGPAWRD